MSILTTIRPIPSVLVLTGAAFIALPAAHAQPFAPEPPRSPVLAFAPGVLAGGSFLGVGVAEVTPERARDLKLREEYGVEITRLEDESPATKAGLKVGDVILEYNGQRVEGLEQFGRLVRETPSGRTVKLLISRNGASQTIQATIGSRKSALFSNRDSTWHFEMPDIQIPEMPQVMAWSSS